ncbi:Pycsar system effector family protein [Leisingera aquaemixtae]|uniref:Pycsar effector protein domain-containing protein n=1 Tax=Leisingera aquaemixtae TaxID=1396826 RepID=A0A0P1H9H6_9RHOB|nr:Pycsar system effector family protein [Leisingera aquaemixtae]CUH99614.1 hypothetical protein PHA8399_01736 [Leisingera aquaemixtae]
MNRLEFLEKNLERQIGFVRASETRVQFLLPSLSVAMAAWLAGFLKADFSSEITVLSGTLALIGFMISAFFTWQSLYPKIDGAQDSNIFFGGIASKTFENFKQSIENIDSEKYERDLTAQVHINANIALRKFKSVQKAMMFWYISLLPLLLFLILTLEDIRRGT